MIELLAAIVVLTIGLLSLTTVLASTNSQSSTAETQQTEIHVGQRELERIAQMKFSDIVLASPAPANTTNANNPDHYVSSSGCTATYQWDVNSSANADTLAIQGCSDPNGVGSSATLNSANPIPHTQTWQSAGARITGTIYDYVTWISDNRCLLNVPPILNCPKYKRVTVAVTNSGNAFPKKPIVISSIIIDPRANLVGSVLNGNPNPLDNPAITCLNGLGQTVTCTNSVGNLTPNTWYLSDSPESGLYTPPTADHATHYTVAPSNATLCTLLLVTGCPVPDLLNTSAPPSSITHEYNFSNEQIGTYAGGRVLNPDVACGSTPSSSDRSKGELWATKPLPSALTLTGNGGLTINTQSVSGALASATVCLAVYDLSSSVLQNLISSPPTPLGIVSYTLAQWPTTSSSVSFSFDFLSSGTHTVPTGNSIGVRLWVAAGAATTPIAVQYDAPSVASTVELDSQ
jgi:Tfp pilus assembly protein PilV